MKVHVKVPVSASSEKIWKLITDIENSPDIIKGIEKVEILNKPAENLVGIKWRETRTLFGKTAIETMWITEAQKNKFYKTRAESHGSVYLTTVFISKEEGGNFLNMDFSSLPQTISAKIMNTLLGFLIKNSVKKALLQDLKDIKGVAEKSESSFTNIGID